MKYRKELLKSGEIVEMDSGKPLPQTVHSMTAYFGAGPIVKVFNNLYGQNYKIIAITFDVKMGLNSSWELK